MQFTEPAWTLHRFFIGSVDATGMTEPEQSAAVMSLPRVRRSWVACHGTEDLSLVTDCTLVGTSYESMLRRGWWRLV